MKRIIQAYTKFESFGGAELIAINIAKGISMLNYESIILSFTPKCKFHKKYDIEHLKITTFILFLFFSIKSKDVIISHHRKITTLLLLYKKVFYRKIRIIHVAHNEFYNLKHLTLFPNEIVAVSNKVKLNLISYFNVPEYRIKVIYNGIKDKCPKPYINQVDNKIKVLFPARVNKIKQQTNIVRSLRGKLNNNIEISFAGVGPDIDELKKISDNRQFKVLGFVSLYDIIEQYDYVMLLSKVEGLPTVLIEALMFGKPIACNDVGGNLEILNEKTNGFLIHDMQDCVNVLNHLPNRDSESYRMMCKNAREKYLENFTFDHMIKEYSNLLRL